MDNPPPPTVTHKKHKPEHARFLMTSFMVFVQGESVVGRSGLHVWNGRGGGARCVKDIKC